jgi:hypothetical protein
MTIEVELDENQIEMVEVLIDFVYVVILRELFELIEMNYLMSRIE